MNKTPTTLQYYLNTALLNTRKNRKEFTQRAEALGFKGKPLYSNQITNTYIKFFNKKFKELYNLKSNPLRDFQITKPALKKDNEGGYYLIALNKFIQNNKCKKKIRKNN